MGHEDADLDFEMMHKLQPKSNLYSMPCITIGLISNHCSNSKYMAYRVEEHSEEQLSSVDEFVQLLGAPRVLVVKNGVCEETASLPGQHLRSGSTQ